MSARLPCVQVSPLHPDNPQLHRRGLWVGKGPVWGLASLVFRPSTFCVTVGHYLPQSSLSTFCVKVYVVVQRFPILEIIKINTVKDGPFYAPMENADGLLCYSSTLYVERDLVVSVKLVS